MQSENRLENTLPEGRRPETCSAPYYFYSSDGRLVVSFDGRWYLFLDNTREYNRGPQRWYIPKRSELLARVGQAMRVPEQCRFSQGQPGGRVFLHSACALRHPASMAEFELLTWRLPAESCFLGDRARTNP
jgi:hypothetical protein